MENEDTDFNPGEHLITDALSCSAAAGGLGLDDFADMTQQGSTCVRRKGGWKTQHLLKSKKASAIFTVVFAMQM